MIQIGNITIEKVLDKFNFCHLSFKDLEDPGYEYREYPDGLKVWLRNDKYHREDGPAAIYSDGTEYWYQNDILHREDGPAMTFTNGLKFWYINGIEYSEENFKKEMRNRNE